QHSFAAGRWAVNNRSHAETHISFTVRSFTFVHVRFKLTHDNAVQGHRPSAMGYLTAVSVGLQRIFRVPETPDISH
ncbi:MAG: hypothetical protein ACR2M4_06460, partial [Actinomycetota bacterium]